MADLHFVAASTGGLQGTYLDSAAADKIARQVGGVVASVQVTADYRVPPVHGGQTRSYWINWNNALTKGAANVASTLDAVAKQRAFVLLNTWDSWMLPELKRRNPAIQCFVYKDLSSTRSYDSGPADLQPCGVRYLDAPSSWFLTDIDGKRIQYSGYEGHWLMDVGNPNYQHAWADNVLLSVAKYGFDGVLMDNALWFRDAYGTPPAKYATNDAYRAAYRSMLAAVQDKVAGSGKLLLANLSNARRVPGGWQSYMQYLDGAWDEWWTVFSDTNRLPAGPECWETAVAQVEENERAGKYTLVQLHCTPNTLASWLYGWASYLLVNGARSAIAEVATTDGYGMPSQWHTEYRWDLGAPLGPRELVSANVWRRRFERGIALVNANKMGSAAVTVPLNGIYFDRTGATRTYMALSGCSGVVLRTEVTP